MFSVMKHCQEFCTTQRTKRKDFKFWKYQVGLLNRKIGLWDVPESLRRNPSYARGIYIVGFRADRMESRERYETDLRKLEVEISLVEAECNHPVLLVMLRTVLDEMRHNLSLFDIYDISDFH